MPTIGILGGSFNPPHNGHLAIARAALEQLELERVLLVPVNQAPHKAVEDDPGADVRLALCTIACEGIDRVDVSPVEVEREGPSWTVDSLGLLRSEHPDAEFVLLLGEDMARTLASWRDPQGIVECARIAWVARGADGEEADDSVRAAVSALGGQPPVKIEMPAVDLSSSLVRERVRMGLPISGLVPAGVEWEIAERGLYRAGGNQ